MRDDAAAVGGRNGAKMTTPILFIHGRGRNTDPRAWVDALRGSIRAAGHTPPGTDGDQYLTVGYQDLLESRMTLPEFPMPELTLGKPDLDRRDSFLLHTATLRERFPRPRSVITAQQLSDVLTATTVRAIPLAHLPLQDRGLVEALTRIMGDVADYGRMRPLRAHVLSRVLEQVPNDGELIIIGHSLGSVVAMDLLSYLPRTLRVPLFLTLGSPLAYRSIRRIGLPGQTAPLPFPHDRIDRWANLVDTLDTVTGFTGLRDWWPEVVDVDVDNPRGDRHSVRAYLSQPAAGELVGEARNVSRSPAKREQPLVLHADDEHREQRIFVELSLHHARCLLESEDSASTRERARHSRDRLLEMASEALGQRLSSDGCESTTQSWRDRATQLERRMLLSRFAFANPFEPFDPGLSSVANQRALARLATELSIPDAEDAIEDLQQLIAKTGRAIEPRSNSQYLKPVLVGIGTIGLVAVAAPAAVGLFAAAGAGGAAAFTSGLAGLGFGGMAGGIGVIGGAGAGGGLLAAQLARSGADHQAVASNLVLVGSSVRWLRRWGDDEVSRAAAHAADGLPQLLKVYEEQLAFHDGFSARESDPVNNLKASVKQTQRLIRWLKEKASDDRQHRQVDTASAIEPGSDKG